ncbi:MAG TPA: tetratricopeptide repeat protein [Bryobacteraceae bacterium]|nr:tetratricopeptide repeat protein [Bryobacteraceae bacterium]
MAREAKTLYENTDYSGSLRMLKADTSTDASGYLLMGKNNYMLDNFATAAHFFEKALTLTPHSSECEMWLGRAYGRRAENEGFVTAIAYATKARQHFEKAVELDPNYADARNDLFDYYLNAPGILGGGLEKAEAIARQIAATRPAESEFELSQIAEHRKQLAEAENHLRRSVELAPGDVGRMLDLARYLAKHGRIPESDAIFAQASGLAPNDPRVLFARAKTLMEQRRNPEQAQKLLRQYLESKLTPDDPPRSAALKLLGQAGGR